MTLERIRHRIHDQLQEVDQFMLQSLASPVPLIRNMADHIIKAGGKRIRPIAVLLAGNAIERIDEAPIALAAVIELIHTATLLHDDVVDGTTLRRGQETANHRFGNKSSVLVGDFLYSRAFQVVVNLKNNAIINAFAEATHYMVEGEIMQLANCHNADTTEAFYFDVILRKTAKLFELATLLPTLLSKNTEYAVEPLKTFGRHLGLAYQLVDDALDYSGQQEQTGKNVYQDLSEGKATLPLIHAIAKSQGDDAERLKKALIQAKDADIEFILKMIESTKAKEYTLQAAVKHSEIAKNALSELPSSRESKALADLCNFVVERCY